MAQTFDVSSNRTKLAATIGATADFVNDYAFDTLNRTARIERHGVGGGNTVAPTRIDLAYTADSQFDAIARYTDLAGEDLAVSTAHAYDGLGRLLSLDHAQGATALAGYAFTYDTASRIETIDSLIDGLTTYSYDTTDQLTAADFATQTDESHEWDANGNPDEVSAVIGPNNQVLSDGTYNYQYDGEGNRIRRVKISDGTSTDYLWDHRNRLTAVIDKDAEGNITQEVHYGYDFANRWIFRSLDDDGEGANASTSQWFAFDGNQVVLSFDDDEATSPDHRYLNGPQVDQYFTDENAENDVPFLLGDHLGTIRDTAMVDALTGDTELKNHTIYGSFHARHSDTDIAFATFIGETGRPHDFATGNDNHLNRWLDGWLKRWMSEDPIGFRAGDSNLNRNVGNGPNSFTDPTGLKIKEIVFKGGLSKDEQAAAEELFYKALDDLIKAGGIGGKMALILLEGEAEHTITMDPRAGAHVTQNVQSLKDIWTISLNPRDAQFVTEDIRRQIPDELIGITAAITLGHELGHYFVHFKDPLNAAVIENAIRQAFGVRPRATYNRSPLPTDEAIQKDKSFDCKAGKGDAFTYAAELIDRLFAPILRRITILDTPFVQYRLLRVKVDRKGNVTDFEVETLGKKGNPRVWFSINQFPDTWIPQQVIRLAPYVEHAKK